MYTNLQNIQPSKSIVESIHESNTGSNVRGHRGQGGQSYVLILGVIMMVLLILSSVLVPLEVALHAGNRASSEMSIARMEAGNAVVQQTTSPSQAEFEKNILQ
ncbi:MAG: hypothetical protein ACI4IA_05640 [Acutalibacteraceae bacterium]